MSRCDHFASMDLQEGLTVGSVVSSGDSGVGPGVGSGVGSAEGSAGGEGFVQLMKIKMRKSDALCRFEHRQFLRVLPSLQQQLPRCQMVSASTKPPDSDRQRLWPPYET